MHARAGRQTNLVPVPTPSDTPSDKRVAGEGPTPRTDKTLRPAQIVKVARALLFRGEESLKFEEQLRPLLFSEWIQRLHVIGQRGRIVVWDFAVSHAHLRRGDISGTAPHYWWCLPESTG